MRGIGTGWRAGGPLVLATLLLPAGTAGAAGARGPSTRVQRPPAVAPGTPGEATTTPGRPPAPHALSDTALALHLLQRATFGARPADLAEVLREGRQAWLERQLHPERIDDSALEARLAAYPAAVMTVAELYRAYPPPAVQKRLNRVDSIAMLADARRPTMEMMAAAAPKGPRGPARMDLDFIAARLVRDVYSQRQLQEVMTDFWFNHFNVWVRKAADRYLVARYEREAIRPYVFGKFEDMLRATAQDPAMLFYLDNWMSTAPDTTSPQYVRRRDQLLRFAALTPGEQQLLVSTGRMTPQQLVRLRQAAANLGKRRPGINENYARELMELHTLGVDGGYTQQDVINVARAFTGWSITRPGLGANAMSGSDVRFVFRPRMHDRGEKVVLGTRLPAGRGMEDGLDVLHLLATSPATAHHIARELVQRFVSDRPDSALVGRIARVFLDTGGDLRAVTRALFTDPAFDDPRYVGNKVKTPLELVTSALRVTDADIGPDVPRGVLYTLRSLGEVPYDDSPPSGYPATAAAWVNSGALLNRMNFALALGAGRLDHVRVDPAPFLGASDPVHALATAFLPGQDTRHLETEIDRLLAQEAPAPPRARLARATGLILGSPEFQQR